MAKILIVDDSRDLTELLTLLLNMNNHDVAVAGSKSEMEKQLPAESPDIILLDVMLGGYNGREICKNIRKQMPEKYIPIILLSASPQHLKDYEECKADGVIEKPFDIDTVTSKIDYLLSIEYKKAKATGK